MLDGSILTDHSPNGTYVIERLSQENEGSYSCLASSEAGTLQSSAGMLIVYGKAILIFSVEFSVIYSVLFSLLT